MGGTKTVSPYFYKGGIHENSTIYNDRMSLL